MKKPKLKLLLTIGFSFFAGFLLKEPTEYILSFFKPTYSPTCVANRICVGYPADKAFRIIGLDNEIGRLDAILCGPTTGDPTYDGKTPSYIFEQDIINGKRCDQDIYTVFFDDGLVTTLFTIRDQEISKITQRTSNVIDP